MAQVIDKIVRSKYPPRDTRVLWFDTTDDSLKSFISKGWNKVSTKIMENITYSQLKYLRDNGKLIPGCYYRITDYQCTTSQANTRSAGHQFDIIVRADSENKLNEEASAIQHEGDEYFANNDLNAWKIWYCLDNNINRFSWVDETNGKGVIYRMIDEWNNDCPYDFKNIIYIFKISFIYKQWGNEYKFNRDRSIDINIDGTQYYGYVSENIPSAWSENKCWIKETQPTISSKLYKRNGSVISYGGSILSVSLDNYSTYTFGKNQDSSITGSCYNNIILPYYNSDKQTLNKNIFGASCYKNIFGIGCTLNIFKNNCHNNIFGDNCSNNISGNSFSNNIFGNNCYKNTFDSNCWYNNFGNLCYENTFGSNLQYNTFGHYCIENYFGDNCSYNIFGNRCYYIKFASDSSIESTKYSYYKNNYFGNGCQYIIFKGIETASDSVQVQNYKFAQGLQGTPNTYLTIDGKRNRAYETKVAKKSNGELKIYCEADLVQ